MKRKVTTLELRHIDVLLSHSQRNRKLEERKKRHGIHGRGMECLITGNLRSGVLMPVTPQSWVAQKSGEVGVGSGRNKGGSFLTLKRGYVSDSDNLCRGTRCEKQPK